MVCVLFFWVCVTRMAGLLFEGKLYLYAVLLVLMYIILLEFNGICGYIKNELCCVK